MTDTPNTTQGKGAVDWTKPIESMDGEPCALVKEASGEGPYGDWVDVRTETGRLHSVLPNGSAIFPLNVNPFSIRNVPEHPTPTQYAPELVERMVALLRKQVAKLSGMGDYVTADIAEARSIVSDLPQEVDPDLILAREIGREVMEDGDWSGVFTDEILAGKHDDSEAVRAALVAIKRSHQRGEAA